MAAKRYYWLKLESNFFNSKEIKLLRRVSGGDTFTIIYLKMLLLSLENQGRLYFEGTCDNLAEELSLDLDENIENINITLSFLEKKGLIKIVEQDEYELTQAKVMTGQETSTAARVRKHRERKQMLQSNKEALQCNTETLHCTKMLRYIDIDKEIDIDKDIKSSSNVVHIDSIKSQEKKKDDDDDYYFKKSMELYQSDIGQMNSTVTQKIIQWSNDLGSELVYMALERTAMFNAHNFGYTETILKQLLANKIKTREDAIRLWESKQQAKSKQVVAYEPDVPEHLRF